MSKHKLLYIPEAKYMLFGDDRHEIIEDGTFRNTKTDEICSDSKKVIAALMTWEANDCFFNRNDIKYPPNKIEFEVIEI